ncbi:Nucleolar protein 12 [Emydomyces testavorans]|uniref:Nucleolar protein 12 n=1 Tax=Emydomyces testavorans TaxID=2070801 RepID=A0AAF0DK64_9EURO|nr:Nucleolar protein 12 [Emydomyces testavorans]
MGKKVKSKTKGKVAEGNALIQAPIVAAPLLFGDTSAAIDPTLASLFANSAGPVKNPDIVKPKPFSSVSRDGESTIEEKTKLEGVGRIRESEAGIKKIIDDSDSEREEEPADSDGDMPDAGSKEDNETDEETQLHTKSLAAEKSRKRKRGEADDALEESYLRKIAKAEEKELNKRAEEKRDERRKASNRATEDPESESLRSSEDVDEPQGRNDSPHPIHESLANKPESDALEKSARTIFLSNVSTEAIKSKSSKKTLLAHLSSFFPSLAESSTPHRIESIRFRSTAFATAAVPKRAAFAKKELMDSTTRSTNAYVVYTTATAARKALSLNGTVVLDRHLRVDSIAHPAPVDNKRCVFVGNLGFVDEETTPAEDATEKKRKKPTPPSDVEEGLWRIFNSHAGTVESVRVVRDPSTRVGKGFAYVQFRDQNGVEAALLLDGKKFPPLLPRTLRVVRAKRVLSKKRDDFASSKNPNKIRLGGADAGLRGRAGTLLGRAGAVRFRSSAKAEKGGSTPFVFEGHRATEGNKGGSGTGVKVKTKNRGRPKTRSARRGKAFKDSKKKKSGK